MGHGTHVKKRAGGGFAFNIKIPNDIAHHFPAKTGRPKSHITLGLGTRDYQLALKKAEAMALRWKAEFSRLREQPYSDPLSPDRLYEESLTAYLAGPNEVAAEDKTLEERQAALKQEALALQQEIDRRELESYDRLPPDLKARLDALEDARRSLRGQVPKNAEAYEPNFGTLGESWLEYWEKMARSAGRSTQTAQQYAPAIRLFAGFIGPKTMRQITREDVSYYVDILQTFDRNWGRSRGVSQLNFWDLKTRFAHAENRLTDRVVRQHLRILSTIWTWADGQGLCASHNPFHGFLSHFRNAGLPQLAWRDQDIATLLSPPPASLALHGAIILALFSGLRAMEIAALRWQDLQWVDDTPVLHIRSLKPKAHERIVPLHPRLQWLWEQASRQKQDALIWPEFSGKGAVLSKTFGGHKRDRGFVSRQRSFQSFRKTVTEALQKQHISSDEIRYILGLSPQSLGAGLSSMPPPPLPLARCHEIIQAVDYPDIDPACFRPKLG
ncbi:hypothetical protein JCM17845_18360 [Iodidimonas gelatinilytica]|uniref:Integrase n=1 Tax=Iodidimonas gelatinilytica TaxID=1236966 RepID=A0A5A7MYZ7_9PROT|nr:DUF6538 domain-containing protein [Iodidimonas gelatinilytica]GER01213.1 hypothetical protein JCM17845_18360 [Iodidimonas gelatinilytica]